MLALTRRIGSLKQSAVFCCYFPYKPERMVEHPAVNRRVVGSNPTGEPSVMDYKSFLIDHHFCFFRGIFAHF